MANSVFSNLQRILSNKYRTNEIPSYELYSENSNERAFERTISFHVSQMGAEPKEIDLIKSLLSLG